MNDLTAKANVLGLQEKETTNTFVAEDLSSRPPIFQLPDELWASLFSTPCAVRPEYFLQVMENLLKNPNITSSQLFRAEIFYDSALDIARFEDPSLESQHKSTLLPHLKPEYQPIEVQVPGYRLQRTVVRKLIPRNPQRDDPLVQTVHCYDSTSDTEMVSLIIYIPHADSPSSIPFYHPQVQAVAFIHTFGLKSGQGTLSLHYRLFPSLHLTSRLQRTALNLIKVIHKHAAGQQAGYKKRVHHDQLVSQKRFQDTYSRLKAQYAKNVIAAWVESTDPVKHVFEDLGIAAFLIELWNDMYGSDANNKKSSEGKNDANVKFPGFVDVGCGNGLLVHILLSEGYEGWGFDARRRKSWSIFPPEAQSKLKELVLVPKTFRSSTNTSDLAGHDISKDDGLQDGNFQGGTFIISNHADELTPWTPLLAYLSDCPFIAIPCCSHNLAGARCRFNVSRPKEGGLHNSTADVSSEQLQTVQSNDAESISVVITSNIPGPGPLTGSLARSIQTQAKPPSAYAGLTAYVAKLTEELGYDAQNEVLRIPSTRNIAIVGRPKTTGSGDAEGKMEVVRRIIYREIGELEKAGREWVEQAHKLRKGKGSGH